MANEQSLVRPPNGLIFSATIFFGLLGVFEFFKAIVRLWAKTSKRRVLAGTLQGVALVLFAYLLDLYRRALVGWQFVLALEVVAVGLLVVIYSMSIYFLHK